MERQQVRKHVRTKCLYAVIPCKYIGIGCDIELKREDMAAHEQDNKMLHKALETVNSQQSLIESLQATVKSLLIKVESQEKVLQNKVFILSEYQKKKEAKKRFKLPSFYTHPNGYHIALKVYVNEDDRGKGTHVSLFVSILEGEYDAELKWPFVGEVTVTLLNQLQDVNHHTKVIRFNAINDRHVGESWGFPTFIAHSALAHDLVKNTQYLKDDKLYFRVSVEVTDLKPWLE